MRRQLAAILQRASAERLLGLVYAPLYRLTLRRMGRGAYLSPFNTAVGLDCVRLGDRSVINRGARLLVQRRWRDQSFEPELNIGADVAIGLNCTLSCMNRIEIGDDSTISDRVYIADTEHEFRDVRLGIRDQPLIVGKVRIGQRVWVGTGAVIAGAVTIGDNAVVGANSVVRSDVEPYTVVAGAPARPVSRYSHARKRWESVPRPAAAAAPRQAVREAVAP